ncbi:MAG: Trm112 family protein [Candidatus Asgardarchaeia archaeon]
MKLDALEFLRCPACKSELGIIIFECEDEEENLISKILTYNQINATEYYKEIEIKSGMLLCSHCKRWYPIGSSIEGIPELLYPDNIREEWRDKKFIIRWMKKIPEEVVREYNLKKYTSESNNK